MMPKISLDLNNIYIIHEGILKKSPPLKSKSLFNMIAKFSCASDKEGSSHFLEKRWRKRYFVLFKNIKTPDELHLLYFKSKPSPESKSLGSINLENFASLSVDAGKKLGKTNVFSIQTVDDKGNNRIYYLSADSFEIMNTWVERIVSCLDLNQKNSKVPNSTPTLQSPMLPNIKNTLRSVQPRPTTPRHNSISGRSNKLIVDIQRTPSNAHHNDNSTAYYNMNSLLTPTLEDSIFTEEDDVYKDIPLNTSNNTLSYKFPCEENNHHSYFNLGEETVTSDTKCSNSASHMFFGNDQNLIAFTKDTEDLLLPTNLEYKNLISNDPVFDEKQNDIHQFNSEKFISLKDAEPEFDFNFELPSRIKSDDSSSTSSCYSSANTNSSTKESISFKEIKGTCPPQVPKRLNVPDCPIVPPPRNTGFDVTLPTKPPKAIKSDNFDFRNNGQIEEGSAVLNYVDATNLLLDNKPQNISNIGFSAFPSFLENYFPSGSDSPIISPDSKTVVDVNYGQDFSGDQIFDLTGDSVSSNLSALCQNSKDVSLIEYREINDARTEGLHKLNERILKNE